jgi:hypothetical protein
MYPHPAVTFVLECIVGKLSRMEEMLAAQSTEHAKLQQMISAQLADIIHIPKSFTVSIC